MMIGAVVYRLRTITEDSLPVIHGHLMHGLCFQLLKEFSPDFATRIHSSSYKPFTASMLSFPELPKPVNNRQYVPRGAMLRWRVTALDEIILQAFLSIPRGKELHIGNLIMSVEEIIANPQMEPRSGVMDEQMMVAQCLQMSGTASVRFDFLSPASFRSGEQDCPFPSPTLVFGSLADKWSVAHPGTMEPKEIRAAAERVSLESWRGHSQRIFFRQQHGVNTFVGNFRFGLQMLNEDVRNSFLLLASYSEFSGIGRLTAQGLGQTRITGS